MFYHVQKYSTAHKHKYMNLSKSALRKLIKQSTYEEFSPMPSIINSLKIVMGPIMWKTLHYLDHDPSMSLQMNENGHSHRKNLLWISGNQMGSFLLGSTDTLRGPSCRVGHSPTSDWHVVGAPDTPPTCGSSIPIHSKVIYPVTLKSIYPTSPQKI